MSIEVKCEKCHRRHRASDDLAGKLAKCPCGAKLSVPTSSDEKPTLPVSLIAASKKSRDDIDMAETAHAEAAAKLDQAVAHSVGRGTMAWLAARLHGTNSIWGKFLVGGAIGGLLGLRALRHSDGPSDTSVSFRAAMIAGGAALGIAAVGLLLAADAVSRREQAGEHVSPVWRWYFGNGLLSLGLWSVTAFAVVIAYVATLEM